MVVKIPSHIHQNGEETKPELESIQVNRAMWSPQMLSGLRVRIALKRAKNPRPNGLILLKELQLQLFVG
jgi:hypothetical protein